MHSSNRNNISMNDALLDSDTIDTIYEMCDAEFTCRKDVHDSFARADGMLSWARYYLKYEVQRLAVREGLGYNLSEWQSLQIAQRISRDWYREIA